MSMPVDDSKPEDTAKRADASDQVPPLLVAPGDVKPTDANKKLKTKKEKFDGFCKEMQERLGKGSENNPYKDKDGKEMEKFFFELGKALAEIFGFLKGKAIEKWNGSKEDSKDMASDEAKAEIFLKKICGNDEDLQKGLKDILGGKDDDGEKVDKFIGLLDEKGKLPADETQKKGLIAAIKEGFATFSNNNEARVESDSTVQVSPKKPPKNPADALGEILCTSSNDNQKDPPSNAGTGPTASTLQKREQQVSNTKKPNVEQKKTNLVEDASVKVGQSVKK